MDPNDEQIASAMALLATMKATLEQFREDLARLEHEASPKHRRLPL